MLPTEAVVMNSITFTLPGALPPPETILVVLERPALSPVSADKFPKSEALPVVAISI